MSVAGDLELIASEARERYARHIFDPDVVLKRMTERAYQGYSSLRIIQKRPLDLLDTEAAHYLLKLLREEDLRYAWRPAIKEGDPLRSHSAVEYRELEIKWEND